MSRRCRNSVLRFIVTIGFALALGRGVVAEPQGKSSAPSIPTQFEEILKKSVQSNSVAAMGIAVVENGRLTWSGVAGSASFDPDVPGNETTRFCAMELSGVVTAWGVMRLASQGKVDLDRPIASYVKEVRPEHSSWSEVTVRHLLTHSAGLSSLKLVSKDGARPSAEDLLKKSKLRGGGKLGVKFQYSAAAYLLLEMLIEKASGKPFAEFMQAEVFDAIGMKNTGYDESAPNTAQRCRGHGKFTSSPVSPIARSANALYTSVGDLARFAIACLPDEAHPHLDPEIVPLFYRRTPGTQAHYFSHLFRVSIGNELIRFGGGGQEAGGVSYLRIQPDTRDAVVVLATGEISNRQDFEKVFKRWVHPKLLARGGQWKAWLADRPGGESCGGFDVDGRRVLLGGTVYDVQTGKPLGQGGGVLSPDGTKSLGVFGANASLRDLTGDPIQLRDPDRRKWLATAWDASKDHLYVAIQADNPKAKKSSGRKKSKTPRYLYLIEKWNLRSGKRLKSSKLKAKPDALVLSDDHKTVLVFTADGGHIVKTSSLKVPKAIAELADYRCLGGWNDGRVPIAKKRGRRETEILDVKKKKIVPLRDGEYPQHGEVTRLADKKTLVGIRGGSVRVSTRRAAKAGEEWTVFDPRSDHPYRIAKPGKVARFVPRLGRCLVGTDCGTVVSYDPKTGASEIVLQIESVRGVKDLQIVGDTVALTLASGRVSGRAFDGTPRWRYDVGKGGRSLLVGNRLWFLRAPAARTRRGAEPPQLIGLDVETGKAVTSAPSSLAQWKQQEKSADGSVMAFSDGKNTFAVHNARTGDRRFGEKLAGKIVNLALTPDGKRALVFQATRCLFYDVDTGEKVGELAGKFGDSPYAWEPGGSTLLTTTRMLRSMVSIPKHDLVSIDPHGMTAVDTRVVRMSGCYAFHPTKPRYLATIGAPDDEFYFSGLYVLDREAGCTVWDYHRRSHRVLYAFNPLLWRPDGRRLYALHDGIVQVLDFPDDVRFD